MFRTGEGHVGSRNLWAVACLKGKRQNSFCLLVEAVNDCQEQSFSALAGSESEVQDVLSQVDATR